MLVRSGLLEHDINRQGQSSCSSSLYEGSLIQGMRILWIFQWGVWDCDPQTVRGKTADSRHNIRPFFSEECRPAIICSYFRERTCSYNAFLSQLMLLSRSTEKTKQRKTSGKNSINYISPQIKLSSIKDI